MAALSTLGVAALGYLGGAAVMFYELPSCDFLNKAFAGASAWYERGRSSIPFHSGAPSSAMLAKITVDKAEKTSDGFTLYTMTMGDLERWVGASPTRVGGFFLFVAVFLAVVSWYRRDRPAELVYEDDRDPLVRQLNLT